MYIGCATDCKQRMFSWTPANPKRELYIMLLPVAGKESLYCRIGLLQTYIGTLNFLKKRVITII